MTVKELEKQSLFCNTVMRDSMTVCGECGENPIHCGMYHPCSRVERINEMKWNGMASCTLRIDTWKEARYKYGI